MTEEPFRFVDLFSGIGGFAAVLHALGGHSVKSVEIDKHAARVYELNWDENPLGDITALANDKAVSLGNHDVLVGGFPCQPFSKSGAQRGMEETRGTLYYNILRVIEKQKPLIVLLENVRNLAGPRHHHELQVILETLREQGYRVYSEPTILSPHRIHPDLGGVPHHRERVFIGAIYAGGPATVQGRILGPNDLLQGWDPAAWDLRGYLGNSNEQTNTNTTELNPSEINWITAWEDLLLKFRRDTSIDLPRFPLWSDDWALDSLSRLPSDAPLWKKKIVEKNQNFFTRHEAILTEWLDTWEVRSDLFPPSRRKLEWQSLPNLSIWDSLIQLRPSGLRVKTPNYIPSLVAITQTPIFGPLRRRLSVKEVARMQGLPKLFNFGSQSELISYKQLGNGVNTAVVWHVLKNLVLQNQDLLEQEAEGKYLINVFLDTETNPQDLIDRRHGEIQSAIKKRN